MSRPFPERTIDAVAACTRALAGVSDADAGLDGAGAATLGALRAAGDRLALRRRHHDPALHRQHQPTLAHAASLFAMLEQARLDVLGVRWLAGVAKNLLDHPGAEDEGLRWFAFEAWSRRAAPRIKQESVARARAGLPVNLMERVKRLAKPLDDQRAFAPAAAAWAVDAAAYVSPGRVSEPSRVPLPVRRTPRFERRSVDSSRLSARRSPTDRNGDQAQAGGPSDAQAGAGDAGAGSRYRAFTTSYDRVVDASALANRAELAQLRQKLEAELSAIRPLIARLAKRLLRMLMARQSRQWRFDLEEGLLDASRLAPFVASGGRTRPFKVESESTFPDTVVSLLIDHSGSMRGRPMLIAALTVEIFVKVLERCGVRCEVLGFTTRDWDGGEPGREWAVNGYPENPGRLNALEHIIVKSADVPWRRARLGLGLFLRDDMLKENIDGESVNWAHERLLTSRAARRILVVISDGTPMEEATLAANGHEYLDGHLLTVVDRIETRSPVQLAAIGIGHDVSRFYRNATRIAKIDDLGPALTARLTALLQVSPAPTSSS